MSFSQIVRGRVNGGVIGYYGHAAFARRGLMREVLMQAAWIAFRKLKLHRIEAAIQPGNIASIALVRACGYRCEGLARELLHIEGAWRDCERWALLESDFDILLQTTGLQADGLQTTGRSASGGGG